MGAAPGTNGSYFHGSGGGRPSPPNPLPSWEGEPEAGQPDAAFGQDAGPRSGSPPRVGEGRGERVARKAQGRGRLAARLPLQATIHATTISGFRASRVHPRQSCSVEDTVRIQ